mgnify:CR=1 FL=1
MSSTIKRIIFKNYNIYTKKELELNSLYSYMRLYMKNKIFKNKSHTSKLFDEWTFISPAYTYVNKKSKNKIKINEIGR